MAERRPVLAPGVLAGIPLALGAYAVFGGVGGDRRVAPGGGARDASSRHDDRGRRRLTPMATIVFFPEGAHGPTNNCAGIGAVLRERGHRVVFILEESFAGTLEARGFEERLMRLGPPPEQEEAPGQFWIDFIHDTAPVFRKPTIEQLGEFVAPTFEALCDGARYVHTRLEEIIDELQPDVIVEDNVVSFPALAASGRRWVRIVSCNPLEIPDPALPPVFSGYPVADRSQLGGFAQEFRRTHAELHAVLRRVPARRAARRRCRASSSWTPRRTSTSTAIRTRSTTAGCRRFPGPGTTSRRACATSEPWELPEHLRDGPGALLYLSLGSLGSADVELMQRLVDILGETRHRVIVSKGPLAEQIRLHDNMCGEGYLPQPAILPQVDLVITHGGNNTTCEAFHHGKPMVVLPIFWDQYDNAQRVHETGLGTRLATYECEPDELTGAVDGLLADDALRARLAAMAARLQSRSGTVAAAI